LEINFFSRLLTNFQLFKKKRSDVIEMNITNSNFQIKNIQNIVLLNSSYNINNYSFDNLDQINNDRLLDIKRMPSQYYFKILLKNNFDILKKL
jgi:hypothetical protein